MMLCFTATGESRRVGSITMSEMWIRRARTLRAAEVISNAPSVQTAVTRLQTLASHGRVFNEVRFLGHGSAHSYYLFATLTPFGGLAAGSTAQLNLTQLDVPSDPSYAQTQGFFTQLAAVLPPEGGLVRFECCLVGGQLNLNKVRTVLAAAGRNCRVQGYSIQINWRLNNRQGTQVLLNASDTSLVTVG